MSLSADQDLIADDEAIAVASDAPAPDPAPEDLNPRTDDAAPFGYYNGRPRMHPRRVRKPQKKKTTAGTGGPTKKATPNVPTPPVKSPQDYRGGASTLVGLVGMGMSLLAQQRKDPALQLDACTVALHEDALVDGLALVAVQVPQVAQLLEWFGKAGPLDAIGNALTAVALQIAANHGKITPGEWGTVGPDVVVSRFTTLMERKAQG